MSSGPSSPGGFVAAGGWQMASGGWKRERDFVFGVVLILVLWGKGF